MATTTTRKRPAPRITKTGANAAGEKKPIIDIQIAPKAVEVVDQAHIRQMLNKHLVDDYGNVGSIALTSFNYDALEDGNDRRRGALDLLVVHPHHGPANFRISVDRAMKSGLTKAVSVRDGFDVFIPFSSRESIMVATMAKKTAEIADLFVKQIKEYYNHPMFKAAPPFTAQLAQAASAVDQIIATAPAAVDNNTLLRKAQAMASNLESELGPHFAASLKTVGGVHQVKNVFKVETLTYPAEGVVLLKVNFALPIAGAKTIVHIGMVPVQFSSNDNDRSDTYLQARQEIDKNLFKNFSNKAAERFFIPGEDVCVKVIVTDNNCKSMQQIRDEVLASIAYLCERADHDDVVGAFTGGLAAPLEDPEAVAPSTSAGALTARGLAEVYKSSILLKDASDLLTDFVKQNAKKTAPQHVDLAVKVMRNRLSDESAMELVALTTRIREIISGVK